ncbi:hypothetical protein CLOSAC_25360 [Clostridium saccharobutylicum]|uniref:Uncharacterized protein n=1 Tax=Clostridium saccharobutylicum TaxID=169679 RepID=A0A1S8N3P3_CLOSA|nr:hypothetical protein CLOSAC_25360 [Clostridium saccharobutylicum]
MENYVINKGLNVELINLDAAIKLQLNGATKETTAYVNI